MELEEHEIIFQPQSSIKALALADFIVEITGHGEVSVVRER